MISYKKGNLLDSGCNIICHQVNCQGVMGSGIAKQIRDRYPNIYEGYRQNVSSHENKYELLGSVLISWIDKEHLVANFFSQYNYMPRTIRHTNYDRFGTCCKYLKDFINTIYPDKTKDIRIGFPYKIGCGLAGGDWNIVNKIIEKEFAGPEWNVEIWEYEVK